MNITLKRSVFTQESTIGRLSINDKFQCYVIEDVDRKLSFGMPTEQIRKIKVHGKTAIPTGTYRIRITMSNRFKKELPLLENVPGFEGIRIHPGNTSSDTEGCLLPGSTIQKDFVGGSREAFAMLFRKIKIALSNREEVWIDIS